MSDAERLTQPKVGYRKGTVFKHQRGEEKPSGHLLDGAVLRRLNTPGTPTLRARLPGFRFQVCPSSAV